MFHVKTNEPNICTDTVPPNFFIFQCKNVISPNFKNISVLIFSLHRSNQTFFHQKPLLIWGTSGTRMVPNLVNMQDADTPSISAPSNEPASWSLYVIAYCHAAKQLFMSTFFGTCVLLFDEASRVCLVSVYINDLSVFKYSR